MPRLQETAPRRRRLAFGERAIWFAGGAVAALVISSTFAFAARDRPETLYQSLQILAEVFSHIENYYVDPVSPQELVYGANRGAVGVLDAHSMFFAPDEYRSLLDNTEGEYAGIGVEIDVQDNGAEIIVVFDDSPAQRAGLERGDRIVGVDAVELRETTFDTVHRLLRGPVGTKIVLTIKHQSSNRLWPFTLIRSWIRVPPLAHHPLTEGLQYIQLKSFPRRVAADLDRLLGDLAPRGIVLDLRNNPGGLFDEAVEVCDLFLRGGLIVTTIGKRGYKVEQRVARDRTPHERLPIAILLDRGSASAAEVVAGALHDRKRARLFGTRSYGKGSVQSILDLSDGSGLKLTIARYVTPTGRQIDGHGIEPDQECDPPSDGDGSDEALESAIAWLHSKL